VGGLISAKARLGIYRAGDALCRREAPSDGYRGGARRQALSSHLVLRRPPAPCRIDGKGVIMMRVEQLRVTPAPAFILKIATALLMTFAATLVLVQAENSLSHSPLPQELTGELF
jgi:hypothetical protein